VLCNTTLLRYDLFVELTLPDVAFATVQLWSKYRFVYAESTSHMKQAIAIVVVLVRGL
jgi:hypothetical protein